ncbi:MAG: hypothetical protein Q9197_002937 [Variospora fuerteventurae]
MCARVGSFPIRTDARPYLIRYFFSDYKDDGTNVLLDANENAYGPSLDLAPAGSHMTNGTVTSSNLNVNFLRLNRYPDPTKDLTPDNLFVGVGSDEAIDVLLRCFCTPGRDKILTCPPTYGMYAVSAQANDVEIVKVPLDTEQAFQLQPEAIKSTLSSDPAIKLVYVCSPGNPTANLMSKSDIQQILEHPTWNGIVVLDEAYIDFSPDGSSLAEWVTEWPNLVVMQTLSKAFGMAGIRLGAAFASQQISRLLNNLKAPYNISSPTSALATAALRPENLAIMRSNRAKILEQRGRLLEELPKIPRIGRFLGGTASNYLLVEILDRPRNQGGHASNESAMALYERLAQTRGVVVRFRGKEVGCEGCLRITVGTSEEVDRLLAETRSILQDLGYDSETDTSATTTSREEEVKETEASGVVA